MAKDEINKEQLKEIMSKLGKLSHKKTPRSKEYYSMIAKKRWDAVDKPVD